MKSSTWSSITFARSSVEIDHQFLSLSIQFEMYRAIDSWRQCQFQQHFMNIFYVSKCFTKIFFTYTFALYFLWKNISAKAAWKMLMKLIFDIVNFTNILWTSFTYLSVLQRFSLLAIWFCSFLWKNISAKAACKMLMKLITDKVNFTNIYTRNSLMAFSSQ